MTSVAAGSPAGAVSVTRVSLFHYAPMLLIVLVVIADSGQRTDPDLWGHIRFGQATIAARHLVSRDPYSYSVPSHEWRNHEWLTEAIMGAAWNGLGALGLKLWKFACVAATIALMALALAETGASAAIQLNILTVAALALMPQLQFRPQLFTFAMLAVIVALLTRHNYRAAAPLWLAVPLMALWANLHGGFIMGAVALAAYTAVVGLQDLARGAGSRRAAGLAAITLASIVATLATPHGLQTWATVLHALRNPVTRIAVTDWQPLTFAMTTQWHANHLGVIYYLFVIGLIAGFAIALAVAPGGGDLPLAAIAAIMSVAAFAAMRNMPLAVIACVPPLARHLEVIGQRRRKWALARQSAREAPAAIAVPARSSVNPWLAGAMAVVLAANGGLFSTRLGKEMPYPDGAVAFMRAHGLRGNILGDFGWGEYLIWHTAPESKVFIDGRYDTVFPYSVINQYIAFRFARPGAEQVLKSYPHDFVLVTPQAEAFALMQREADWKLVYRDTGSALFARANSEAAAIPNLPYDGGKASLGYFP